MSTFKVYEQGGRVINPGDLVFEVGPDRVSYPFRYATRPTTSNKSGKIVVDYPGWEPNGRELYAHIFRLTVLCQHDPTDHKWATVGAPGYGRVLYCGTCDKVLDDSQTGILTEEDVR